MKNQKKKSFFRRVFLWLLAILLAVCVAFGVYVSDYYHRRPDRQRPAGLCRLQQRGRRAEPRKI